MAEGGSRMARIGSDVHPFVGARVTHRCRVFQRSRAAFWLTRLAMDARLIALIKIHVARRRHRRQWWTLLMRVPCVSSLVS